MITNKQIVINGCLSSYTEAGEGAPFLLLHGWGCSANTFKDLQTALAAKYRVLAVDFPGFGRTGAAEAVWGCVEYAQWTQQFIQKLQLDAPVVLGHSFGGRIALALNSRIRIPKLILTGVPGLATANHPQKKNIAKFLPAFLKKGRLRELLISIAGSEDYKRASPHMREVLKKVLAEDLAPFAKKIKSPTLLIWGANDKDTPPAIGAAFHALIPSSTLEIMEGCGHYAFLEDKAVFLDLVTNFLEKP
jgi:pimeloyl-ACP methyl ester carboxylesterase